MIVLVGSRAIQLSNQDSMQELIDCSVDSVGESEVILQFSEFRNFKFKKERWPV